MTDNKLVVQDRRCIDEAEVTLSINSMKLICQLNHGIRKSIGFGQSPTSMIYCRECLLNIISLIEFSQNGLGKPTMPPQKNVKIQSRI